MIANYTQGNICVIRYYGNRITIAQHSNFYVQNNPFNSVIRANRSII